MIPSDHFVMFYNEVFKFLERRGPEALKRYYRRVADRQADFTLADFRRDGLKGMYDYWERIRIEENCELSHVLSADSYEARMTRCPSLSKALESDAGPCRSYCDHCPGWVLDVIARAGYFSVFDIVGRTVPECRWFASGDRYLAERKFSEWTAEHGADAVKLGHEPGMVTGRIADSVRFEGLHPRFARAFGFLRRKDVLDLRPGKYPIDGEDVYAFVSETDTRPFDSAAKAEIHRRFIDIQVPLSGPETYGYVYDPARAASPDFDVRGDIALFDNAALRPVTVKPGSFVVFFNGRGVHSGGMTTGGSARLRKLVIKVRG